MEDLHGNLSRFKLINFSNGNISLKIRYVRACACERYNLYRYTLHYNIINCKQKEKKLTLKGREKKCITNKNINHYTNVY